MFYILAVLALFFHSQLSWALAPIESVTLGNFSESFSENTSDPLNYVFSRDKNAKNMSLSFKKELALYRGFYEEAKNTVNYCKSPREIHYATDWEKVQVKRALFSEIQYIGLDLTSRALPQYAKALEFTKAEYTNLVNGLVGNYCSNNLSVISKKELRNNLLIKFDRDNSYKLPTVVGNPNFPDNMDSYTDKKTALEQEFKYTVKLFQTVCSWSGNPTNPGLLVPILKNPALMAFFIRQMSNQEINWKEFENVVFLTENKNTVQVWCDNLICRKTTYENFNSKYIYSVGGTSISEDLRRLFCEETQILEYNPAENDERIAKIMNTITFEEQNFINGQFIALITGVPDFLLKVETYKKAEDLMRASVDFNWTNWAKNQTEILNRELYFEESLTIELVDRDLYFNRYNGIPKVAFDVNLGEFDRTAQRSGKVRVSFDINIQKSFLNYYFKKIKTLGPDELEEKEKLFKRLKIQLTKDIEFAKLRFIIPPWKGDIETLIANEISDQLNVILETNFKIGETGFLPVNIEFNYGLFALKYINHLKNVQSAKESNLK